MPPAASMKKDQIASAIVEPVMLRSPYTHLMSGTVDQEESVLESSRGDTVTISDIHHNDIEWRFGTF
jgi:hypothetical protein